MCIVFWTLSHPGYKLILAANRDEYLQRPALPAHWHDFGPVEEEAKQLEASGHGEDQNHQVLSGRDMGAPAAATWLGMTRDLRVGVLTNIRHGFVRKMIDPPSRGLLLKEFLSTSLEDSKSIHDHLSTLRGEAELYEGFNLLLFQLHPPATPPHSTIPLQPVSSSVNSSNPPGGSAPPPPPPTPEHRAVSSIREQEATGSGSGGGKWGKPEVGYLSNSPSTTYMDIMSPTRVPTPMVKDTGQSQPKFGTKVGMCFGLSNSNISQPWPKVGKGESAMSRHLKEWSEGNEKEEQLVERMMDMLSDSISLDSLANAKQCTCIHPVKLGSNPDVSIKQGEAGRWYGTRVSTVILVDDMGHVTFVEKDRFGLDSSGEPTEGQDTRRFSFTAQSRRAQPD